MQSFKSAVFTAFAALFLVISLVACSDEGSAPTSQGSENGSSLFESGDVKLVLKPGAHDIYMGFFDDAARDRSAETIRHALENSGVAVKDLYKSENYLFVSFDPIGSELSVNLDKTGLRYIKVKSPLKTIAEWDSSMGSKIRHID